jgi:hypothetical protein
MYRLALLALASLSACAVDPEAEVSIEQGVYGLTISGCDTSNCQDDAYSHALLYATPAAGGGAVMVKSDGDGFFEMSLPAGDYRLCVHACVTISVAEGGRLRRDFIAGPGGGIWCVDGTCGPME